MSRTFSVAVVILYAIDFYMIREGAGWDNELVMTRVGGNVKGREGGVKKWEGVPPKDNRPTPTPSPF